MTSNVLRVGMNIACAKRHSGLDDPAAQAMPNLIDVRDEVLFGCRSLFIF
jgi:hypothetical protein